MKLCLMSILYENLTPKEIVQLAVKKQITAIDWIGTHNAKATELKKMCDDNGIFIAAHTSMLSGFRNGDANWIDDIKRGIDFALLLDTPILMIPPFPLKNQASLTVGRDAWLKFYETACPMANVVGLTLAIEATGYENSPITKTEEQLEILSKVPGLKVAYDCGNTATSGSDILTAWDKLKEYVVHVHLKDGGFTDGSCPNAIMTRSGKYFHTTPIGSGELPIDQLWKKMKNDGYTGYLNLETNDNTGKLTPEEVLHKSAEYLRQL